MRIFANKHKLNNSMKTRKYSMKNHHYQMKTAQIFNEKSKIQVKTDYIKEEPQIKNIFK